jgi:type IV pilus assembly protein PilW
VIHVRDRTRMRGVSLIELMVAVAIGALLLIGLVQVFGASRTAYQMSSGMARTQENGRFAIDYLQRDLRMAGHLGCVNDQSRFLPGNTFGSRLALSSTFLTTSTSDNYAEALFTALRFDRGIEGFEATGTAPGGTRTLATTPALATAASWTTAIPAQILADMNAGSGPPIAGSDVIILRYFSPNGAQVVTFSPGTPTTLAIAPTQVAVLQESSASRPMLLGIADCMNAAVFQATAFSSAGAITVGTSGTTFNRDTLSGNESFVVGQAYVHRAEAIVYYVGRNVGGNPALYRMRYVGDSAGTPTAAPVALKEELVEGVESLQLRYGQDSFTTAASRPTGNVGSSATADALAGAVAPDGSYENAWRRVGLIQVGLVMRSGERAAVEPRAAGLPPMSALGVAFNAPDDKYYRTVYEDSVALRNRLFGN